MRPLPAAFLVVTSLVSVASVPISVGLEPSYDTVLYALHAVALALAGALIASHQRDNPIGWVLIGIGLDAAWVEFTEGYGNHSGWPWAVPIEWFTNWANMLGIGATSVLLTLFPSGRALSQGRRALVWTGAVATALMAVGAAFGHSSDPAFGSGTNPYAIGGLEPVYVAGQVLFNVTLLAAIGSLVHRFHRSTGVERQQLKWIVYVVSVLAVVGPLAGFAYNDSALVRIAIAVVVTALPIAICVAILRYRLNDIDVVINRTLVYGALTVLLTAAYLATALVLGAALGGRDSPWVTAGATLAVAGAFRPLRARIQDAVDRRFRRARYDALARVDAFLEDVRAGRADPETLQQLLREIMSEPDLEVCYLLPHTTHQIDGAGRDVEVSVAGRRAERLVERAGTPLAVVHTGATEDSPGLLDEVLTRASLAIEVARLRAEVRHQLTEVEASRARIVAAGYEERRRLERDLHDGAQQRLVSIGLVLRNAQFELGDSPIARTIDAAVEQLTVAIADLRELANGVRPAYLDNGLDMALRELAGRTPLPIDVYVGAERYPTDIEATAYFVACEALTNAVKHSAATGVELRAQRLDDHLVMTVRDNGVGGALPSGGTGLRGLSDRVAAQGGRIRVESENGSGTTVIAELPCVL
ncbi:putative two-component system sensor kinase [Alloactinosynnema sp. L-07]|uniref:sensor histidine kinase n=1 Tax=Alloactinosynnema sp. L-07 TaxID=1653480 RepID=UPI00065EFCC8|nr:sensor histidine kinase [Alloactinosynnema sp. L-07]CRK58205.1 putative two-component system sensor kinase [Alloactinosynnema sp. L-07]